MSNVLVEICVTSQVYWQRTTNKLQSTGNILTAHVLVSLNMGALCNADTTAMTAWRLFMSHSFCEEVWSTLSRVYNANGDKRTQHGCHVVCWCVYLGSANVQTQHLGSDLQRLCMEDLSYNPETRLENKEHTHTRTEIKAPNNTCKLTENSPGILRNSWQKKKISLIFHIFNRFELCTKWGSEFCLVKSPVFESGAKVCRHSWHLWAETRTKWSWGAWCRLLTAMLH